MTLHHATRTSRALLLAAFACVLPATVAAGQCRFGFDAALDVAPAQILIEDAELGAVVIDERGTLAIDGRDVPLDTEQQAAVEAWASQLREVVPGVVEVAIDGVEIAMTTVSEVFAALVDGEVPPSVRSALADLRADVDAGLGREDGVWYVRRDGIEGLDETMESMEPLIENAVSESVGAMLVAMGRSMQSGDGSFEARMDAFGERMARLDEEIETRIEDRTEAIEARAEALCTELRVLAAREEEMKARVPELTALRVLTRS
ncbi:MAG: DUF2884 family protein [Pseudomonadales bacterium]|jgi:hypothetical protein|nr:DUF2884 family protein [Pseudomonadales bacterium]